MPPTKTMTSQKLGSREPTTCIAKVDETIKSGDADAVRAMILDMNLADVYYDNCRCIRIAVIENMPDILDILVQYVDCAILTKHSEYLMRYAIAHGAHKIAHVIHRRLGKVFYKHVHFRGRLHKINEYVYSRTTRKAYRALQPDERRAFPFLMYDRVRYGDVYVVRLNMKRAGEGRM